MSIPLTTNPGGIFTRLGVLINGSNEAQFSVNQALNDELSLITGQYETTDQAIINGLFASSTSYQGSPQSWLSSLQTLMQNTVIQMAQDDAGPPVGINPYQLGSTSSLAAGLIKLIGQMESGAQTIQQPTITAAITPELTVGNGTLTVSYTDWDGRQLDYLLAEQLTVVCINSGYPGGGGTAGSEQFQVTGQVAAASIYAPNYPAGSGANTTLTTLNTSLTSGLILTDGDFEQWTSNTPTQWTITVGAGTITKGVSPYTGNNDLQITGDGSTLTALHQPITLAPNTVYAFNCYMKKSAGTGVVTFSLTNGSGVPLVNNQNATQTLSFNLTSITTSYTAFSGFFQTPNTLPSTVWLQIALSTAISNTNVLSVDAVGLQVPTQIYAGGPWLAMFTGSVDYSIGDYFNLVMTNSATTSFFTLQLARYFSLATIVSGGLKIPSSNSPTISNTLISGVFPAAPLGPNIYLDADTSHIDVTLSANQTGAASYDLYSNGSAVATGIAYSSLNPGPYQYHPGRSNNAYQLASTSINANVSHLTAPVAINVTSVAMSEMEAGRALMSTSQTAQMRKSTIDEAAVGSASGSYLPPLDQPGTAQ